MTSQVTILSRSEGCPVCTSVKSVFKALGLEYAEIDVDKDAEKASQYLAKARSRSLPLMYVNGENVASGAKCIEEARAYAR